MRFWGILVILLATTVAAFAQNDTVEIRGVVLDAYNYRQLSGVSIINSKASTTISTDGNGYFDTKIRKRDTLLLFFPGYRTTQFSVADSAPRKIYVLRLMFEPLNTGLSQPVIIKAQKNLEEIEAERKKLGQTPKELDRPEIEPFSSPISALYEVLSGRAKEREKLKSQIKEDERRKVFRELLDYYNENGLIDLPEDRYDDFINFCNLPLDYLKYNTDYEITKTIITQFDKYSRLSGLVK